MPGLDKAFKEKMTHIRPLRVQDADIKRQLEAVKKQFAANIVKEQRVQFCRLMDERFVFGERPVESNLTQRQRLAVGLHCGSSFFFCCMMRSPQTQYEIVTENEHSEEFFLATLGYSIGLEESFGFVKLLPFFYMTVALSLVGAVHDTSVFEDNFEKSSL
jgi:hypothetical protein